MNEEQAVLDFFAKAQNLPLGLAVAELIDKQREQLNNRFWLELQPRLEASINQHEQVWQVESTEDRTAAENLLGLHCNLRAEQAVYLRPMMEQQLLGGNWRVYFGLMWSAPPSPGQLGLPAVNSLKDTLQKAGFKCNDNFLAWQWTAFHPRRKDFLLRYTHRPDKLLGDMESIFKTLLPDCGELIGRANTALHTSPRSATVSLDQLRRKSAS